MQADADDLGSVRDILRGLKKRYQRTGTPPILIHTVSPLLLTSHQHLD